MDVILECCCGIDVHKKTLVACLLKRTGNKTKKDIKRFTTMTNDLLKLREWLYEEDCIHVAIESTGPYWKPVFNILEEAGIDVLLANAKDVKNVPGRKTDMIDSEWIAKLLHFGLIKSSFIPPLNIRELRDMTRYREKLIRMMVSEKNRVQKVLEDANIKLASVATDIFGVSGRAMLGMLLNSKATPDEIAELAKGRLRNKIPQLIEALTGYVSNHHRFMIKKHLEHISYLYKQIEELNYEVKKKVEPYEEQMNNLMTIPGVKERVAQCIIAEIGVNMKQFPTEPHIASWAGVCPGNNESAGKRYSGKTTHGNKWLKAILNQASRAASREKGTYTKAQYHRIARRRGDKRAIVAVSHSILGMSYYILLRNKTYIELGEDYFDKLNKQALVKYHVKRLESLDFTVTLKPNIIHKEKAA
jgi:transposase